MRQIAHIEVWGGRPLNAVEIARTLNITARLVRYYRRRPQYKAILKRENCDRLAYIDELDQIEIYESRKTWAGVLIGWGK
jgi:hypothetical protein